MDAGEREGLTTDDREELCRLMRENRPPRQERKFLKKLLSSSRGRLGLGELLLRALRGGEGRLLRSVHVSRARRLK